MLRRMSAILRRLPIRPRYRAWVPSAASSTASSTSWQRVTITTKSAGPGTTPPSGSRTRSQRRTSSAWGNRSRLANSSRSSITAVRSPTSEASTATRSPTCPPPYTSRRAGGRITSRNTVTSPPHFMRSSSLSSTTAASPPESSTKCMERDGAAAARSCRASWRTAPSSGPPPMVPLILPSGPTSILAPASRGADLLVSITVQKTNPSRAAALRADSRRISASVADVTAGRSSSGRSRAQHGEWAPLPGGGDPADQEQVGEQRAQMDRRIQVVDQLGADRRLLQHQLNRGEGAASVAADHIQERIGVLKIGFGRASLDQSGQQPRGAGETAADLGAGLAANVGGESLRRVGQQELVALFHSVAGGLDFSQHSSLLGCVRTRAAHHPPPRIVVLEKEIAAHRAGDHRLRDR